MNKKIYFVGIMIIVFIIFLVPKSKNNKISINHENYHDGSGTKTAVEFLKSKANSKSITNYEDGNIVEMYTFDHDATEQTTALTDYRYIGKYPNNYIYFNCTNIEDESTCEKWRIIGIFTVEDENGNLEERIKIIRDGFLNRYYADDEIILWDTNEIYDWPSATLNEYLNEDYYSTFSDETKAMIGETKYYLGGYDVQLGSNYGSTEDIYTWERGNLTYSKDGRERSKNWIGKLALIYPSDNYYIYANNIENICFNTPYNCSEMEPWGLPKDITVNFKSNWMFIGNKEKEKNYLSSSLTLSMNHYYYYYLPLLVTKEGYITNCSGVEQACGSSFRPVLYLKNNLFFTSGDGTEEHPYKLSFTAIPNKEEESLTCTKQTHIENETKYLKYYIGDEILYNNEKYIVIEKSGYNSDYVVALKKEFLTYDDIQNNKGNLDINVSEGDSDIGLMSYFYNTTCNDNLNTDCNSSYNNSHVKKILENWINPIENDLMEVNGYKVRLLDYDDLINLSYQRKSVVTDFYSYYQTSLTPKDIYEVDYSYWTMHAFEDANDFVYTINNNIDKYHIYEKYALRPVVNFKKCSINGCYNEEIEVDDGCVEEDNSTNIKEDEDNTNVIVDNTLKVLLPILLIISVITIICGFSVLGYNYIKSKKERK